MKDFSIKGRYIVTLVLWFASFLLIGQDHYVFYPIDSKDGLSGNRVRTFGQLPDGRMVIVTDGLVNIYDGSNFTYLHYNDNQTYPLSKYSGHHRLYIDNNNGLWIKNWHHLLFFDLEKEKFVPNLDSVLNQQNIDKVLADIFIDANNNFWYLSNDNDLYVHNLKRKNSILFLEGVTKPHSEMDVLYDISVVNDQVFVFYRSGLVRCFNMITHELHYEHNPLSNYPSAHYQQTLMVVPYKNLLFQIRNGTNGGIMFKYNVKNKKWEEILSTKYRLNTLTVDEAGNCYVSSTKGFWYINANLSEKKFIPELSLEDGRVFETEISTQYNDNSGGLWIGTFNRGILYYHPNRFLFRNSGYTLFEDLSVKNLFVTCFSELDNTLYVGTNNGLYQKSKSHKILSRFKELPPNINCNNIHIDNKNRIWLATGQSGVFRIEDRDINNYSINDDCFYILEEMDGNIYLFTSGGIYHYSADLNEFKLIPGSNTSKFRSIKQVVKIGNGSFLCISENNVFAINCNPNQVILASSVNDKLQKGLSLLSNHQFNSIYFDSRGIIWIGTQDGLNALDISKGILKSFYTNNNLVNNCVQSIMEDIEKRIWVSTSNGISRIDIQENGTNYSYELTNFNEYDGIISSEFFPRSSYRNKSGHLYWGGIDGYNEIVITQLDEKYAFKSKPILSDLFIFGSRIKKQTEYKGNLILTKSLAVTDKIDLRHNQNFIRVEFSAMNYINALRTFYRYQLEGYEENWHHTGSVNGVGSATYTDLPPGSYRLKIQSANTLHSWGENSKYLHITIQPPLWRTPLFYIFYLILIAVSLYYSISYFIKKNKTKRNREQKEALDQMKFAFFTNVSHELRTPLTLIITPLNSILKRISNEQLKVQLSNIKRNADELLNIVNQLLDFRKLEMQGEHLILSYCNIGELIGQVCGTYEELAKEKKIYLSWKGNNNISAYIDSYKIKKVVNNLLSNAFKFTPKEGKITLELYRSTIPGSSSPSIVVKIKDSGCGIAESEKEQIFDRFYQANNSEDTSRGSGIGLHIAKEYIQMHEGKIDLESKVNQGSTFIIHLPTNLKTEIGVKNIENEYTRDELKKILIVEDNYEFRNFIKTELSALYSVFTAKNGSEALEMIHENYPDIIISDYSMPEMNGYELCKQIKQDIKTSHIPFIMLTARTTDKDQIQSFEVGADAYITKPFNMDILLLRIQKLIEKQEARKNLFKNTITVQPQMLASTDIDEDLINRALKCVKKNLADPSYSIDQFGKDMFMDRTGLYRKLKAIIGQSPSTFIRSVRLKKSTELLSKGIPVSEVAFLVGFGSLSYFSKSFFDEFGVKPSKWVSQNRTT